jgi:hypothetical protein
VIDVAGAVGVRVVLRDERANLHRILEFGHDFARIIRRNCSPDRYLVLACHTDDEDLVGGAVDDRPSGIDQSSRVSDDIRSPSLNSTVRSLSSAPTTRRRAGSDPSGPDSSATA